MTDRAVEAADEAGYAVDRDCICRRRRSKIGVRTIASCRTTMMATVLTSMPVTWTMAGTSRKENQKRHSEGRSAIFVTFLSYCLRVALCAKLNPLAPSLAPQVRCSTGHSSRACHSSDSTGSCKPATLPKIPIVLRLTS
jgi:hypothetical protein